MSAETRRPKVRIPKARFFFALRPDPSAAAALAESALRLAAAFGGRPLAAADVHLTLVFVGMRPLADAGPLAGMLDGLPARVPGRRSGNESEGGVETLPLVLSRLGSFGHGVLWIGPSAEHRLAGDRPLEPAMSWVRRLQTRLQTRLRDAGIAFDERPLRLHVTLVRGAQGFGAQSAGAAADPPVVAPTYWNLALGFSDANSTPLRRYQWVAPPAQRRTVTRP